MNALITVAVVHLVATAMPGPNVLLVLRTAISRPRRDAFALTLGIAVSDAAWALAALIGLGVVFAELTWLYDLVRIVGACYLVLLGVQTWRGAREALHEVEARPGSAFRLGLLTNVTNPKTVVFFASVFASALPLRASLSTQVGAIAILAGNALWFHGVLALLCSHPRAQQVLHQAKMWIDRITGALLAGFGIALLAS